MQAKGGNQNPENYKGHYHGLEAGNNRTIPLEYFLLNNNNNKNRPSDVIKLNHRNDHIA